MMFGRLGYFAVGSTLLSCITSLQISHEDVFNDADLFSYITMPDVKVPRFNMTINISDKISPGYWFVAPYSSVDPWKPIEDYKPHQIGPMIYDGNGELVWSGAHMFQDRSVFDFKSTKVNGESYLSFIINCDTGTGKAMILDNSYQNFHEIDLPQPEFNMHEFNVVDNGRSALVVTSTKTTTTLYTGGPTRTVTDNGFSEIDLETGTKLFEWTSLSHVNVSASQSLDAYMNYSEAFDYFHLNSVDKSKVNGDYIISARYTDTIYRISAQDGSIVWRFGGVESSFQIPDELKFIAQHDTRILDEYDSTVILSFLNNGADDSRQIRASSAGHIVALDTETMTARLLHTYSRPDGQITHGRGNIQVLPGGNVFANWADNAYISEHNSEGEVIWEAQFSSKRFVTYRAYKFDFKGRPLDRPVIEAHASVTADAQLTTVFHVSWNGATQVRNWNFYACLDDICERSSLIGSTRREGFETIYTVAGLHLTVYAEAVDADGRHLGESLPTNITLSVLPVVESRYGHAGYDFMIPRLFLLSLLSTVVTIFWMLCRRRRRRRSFVVWTNSEKQACWNR